MAKALKGAGLYLHVPFCSTVCPYCDFAVQTGGAERRAQFVASLEAEIALWREGGDLAPWGVFDTVYFGGGTPSALAAGQLEQVLAAARRALPIAGDAWVAIEVNPEDVTAECVHRWRQLGVSMLSLGVQSFDAATLRFLGRRHDPRQARRAVELALAGGFASVSVDLMYGRPSTTEAGRPEGRQGHQGPRQVERQRSDRETLAAPRHGPDAEQVCLAEPDTFDVWRRDLRTVVELAPQHLSCYQLTIHGGTAFGTRAARGELVELPDDEQARLFRFTHTFLGGHGYAAYEVSNFAAAPHHRSRHNRKYWDHTPYLGLGPSAHSFDGRRRWWNHRKLATYQASLAAGRRPLAGHEDLTPADLALEELMLALRTTAGLDMAGFHRRHGLDLASTHRRQLDSLAARGLASVQRGHLVPTLEGLAVADSLARAFDLDLGESGRSTASHPHATPP